MFAFWSSRTANLAGPRLFTGTTICLQQLEAMQDNSALDDECLALESIFEDNFTRLEPNKIRLIILHEAAEEGGAVQITIAAITLSKGLCA